MRIILFLFSIMAIYLSLASTRMSDCSREIETRDSVINQMRIDRDSLINDNAILKGQVFTYKQCCFNRLK
jgi:hypothetical protein